eukprot:COSAG03_NODE_25014_length_268_cov_0.816568_1_plen_34_part_10
MQARDSYLPRNAPADPGPTSEKCDESQNPSGGQS